MNHFNPGQAVWSIRDKAIGIVVDECKNPPSNWMVVMKNRIDNKVVIKKVPQSDLQPYVYHCWNCYTKVDSSINDTCSECGWVICPECNECKKKACSPNDFIIQDGNHYSKLQDLTEEDLPF